MLRRLLLLLALSLPLGTAHATVLIDENFDVANMAALFAKSWTPHFDQTQMSIVSSPTFSGSGAIKFIYPPGKDGVNSDCCNSGVSKTFAGQDEIWERWYVRYDKYDPAQFSTFTTSGNNSMKQHFYNDAGAGSITAIPEFSFASGTFGNGYPGGSWDEATHMEVAVNFQNYGTGDPRNIFNDCPSGTKNSPTCTYPQNQPTRIASLIGNGHWYCYLGHYKANTPGARDGIIEFFIDGTMVMHYDQTSAPAGVRFRTLNTAAEKFQKTFLYRQGATNLIRYEDEYKLGTQRTDVDTCGGSPSDTTPPANVTGLAVSTAGAATWNATTDNAGGSGLANYILLRSTGVGVTPSQTLVSLPASATSYTDASIIAGTVYNYAIKASDAAGNTSAQSATVTITAAGTVRTVLATYTPSGTGADLGAAWDAGYTGKTACQLVSSTVEATTLNTDCMETYNAISAPNDQWIQASLTAFTGTKPQVGCITLRTANAPTINGYLICAERNGGSGVTTLIQKLNGTTNPILVSETSTTWAATDYLRAEIQGSTIKAIRGFSSSEAMVLSTSDTTYTSGKLGELIFIGSGGALTDIKFGVITMGGFTNPTPPAITNITNVSRTQATVTWDLNTVPTNIRAFTGNQPVGTVTAPLSSYPSGVYTYPPTILNKLTNYICFIAQDSGGAEITGGQLCASVPAAPIDTAPPIVTLSAPTSTLPQGMTSSTLAVTLDKAASCRNDTVNPAGIDYAAYASMANAMNTFSLTASGTITGLSAGTVNYYVRCDFMDINGTDHPNPTSLTVPVTVAASTPDLVAPSDVTGNACTVVGATQVSCTWNAATAHGSKTITGYQVALSYGASNTTYNLVGLPVPVTHTITDVTPNTIVNTVIKAVDSSNILSANYSNVGTVTTPSILDSSPPSTMTNLHVDVAFTSSIILSWDQCIDDSGLCTAIIELCQGAACTNFTQAQGALISATQLQLNLLPGTLYRFRGLFSDGTNNSLAYSSIIDVTTMSSGLGVPRAAVPFAMPRSNQVGTEYPGTRPLRPQ